ncbi:MAG: substrate-binding domain-containing protein [Geminicoccaceae bacterium]
MLAGITNGNDRTQVASVTSRLAYHGLDPWRCASCADCIDDAREASGAVLPARPDAVICGNDVIAYGVLSEAHSRGVNVSDSLAVTGFDDLPVSAELAVPPTTLAVPAEAKDRRHRCALLFRRRGLIDFRKAAPARDPRSGLPASWQVRWCCRRGFAEPRTCRKP